ncbi:aminotransferase class IV [Isoptericola variabilis]|uniref:Aminotransferase class IV n=1 Tax=Isoptericola variabilis (strain 225) TaxID=743718 RepID=F6FW16_ISOV2|nr:aminotransferase class IV [Isoptericola variabilis]AEG44486.1 aminotransferase class IV [Isoptericola variabilis 225]TWH26600.1 branched-chain amino acid aminotransferase [Isoptericola variabilis J7]
MSLVIWADGRLVGQEEAALSAVDHGVTVGDGVFETCTVFDGQVFALTRHLQRLARSATGLGLAAPDEQKVRDGVAAVLDEAVRARGPFDGRLRITVTAGVGPLGSGRVPGAQTVVVAVQESAMAPTSRSVRSPWPRNERSAVAGLKTTSYAENVVALADAVAKGGDEAILANTVGDLCEGTGSNVFVERGGELVTPTLASGCLAGITRALLLEWGAEAGLPVREATDGELPFSVLDEVTRGEAQLVLTSSGRNVQPVTWLDGADVAVGDVSAAARELFEKLCRERLDP